MSVQLFTPRREAPEADRPESRAIVSTRGREAAALLLFAVSVYLVLALFSLRVDSRDPSLEGANWVGPVGAAVAGVLVKAVGIVAWLAPLELAILGVPLLRRRPNRATIARALGDLIVAIVLASLVQVAMANVLVFGRALPGGHIGLLFGELMRAWFSTVGSFLVGGTVVGLILIERASWSFIDVCRKATTWSRLAMLRASDASDRAQRAWRTARSIRAARQEAARLAAQPSIDTSRSDEAIIAHFEDEDRDSFPVEVTGTPPVALSETLRATLGTDCFDMPAATTRTGPSTGGSPLAPAVAAKDGDLEEDPDAEEEELCSDAPVPVAQTEDAPAPGRRGRAGGPTIVDTRPHQKTRRAQGEGAARGTFHLPPTTLMEAPQPTVTEVDKPSLFENAKLLEKTLADYGVSGRVVEIHPGPTVTTYEVEPAAGTKVSKVANLCDDLALGLSRTVRIIAPIPNKARIGFELPNDDRVPVNLRELVEDERFAALAKKAPLPVVLGRDIVGAPFYADLASMPHVIVAGATGAGKSVGLNVMLASLLFARTPDELRLLMIDPKVVELAPFDGIPHMLLPVVTDMKQAATALKWAVDEMERRYQLFANAGTKNIVTYNGWVKRVHDGKAAPPDPTDVEAMSITGEVVTVGAAKDGSDGRMLPGRLPYIVVVVDAFADLMMQQGKEVETSVARLAQKARAAGMHVILATQRPSVDVITGMIKANFPTRIGFRVAQKVDSRTILDEQGAELLLGKGDMLVKMNGTNETKRVQCPFVSEEEVGAVTQHLRSQGTPQYHDAILRASDDEAAEEEDADDERVDPRFDEAVQVVATTRRCSTSWLQRKMGIGYNRAAKIVDLMERRGLVGPQDGARDRDVLLAPS